MIDSFDVWIKDRFQHPVSVFSFVLLWSCEDFFLLIFAPPLLLPSNPDCPSKNRKCTPEDVLVGVRQVGVKTKLVILIKRNFKLDIFYHIGDQNSGTFQHRIYESQCTMRSSSLNLVGIHNSEVDNLLVENSQLDIFCFFRATWRTFCFVAKEYLVSKTATCFNL